MKHAVVPALCIATAALSLAAAPATQPAPSAAPPPATPHDPTMDWLLGQATTAPSPQAASPAEAPATQPALLSNGNDIDDSPRKATLTLSNGITVEGDFTTTPDQPLRVWEADKNQYEDVPFEQVASMEAGVEWERMEQEWKFVQSGSDVKEFSGKSYPARLTSYTFTLTDGRQITGEVAAPLYLQRPDGTQRIFILHKRDKGNDGQVLGDLVYVKRVEFAGNPNEGGKNPNDETRNPNQ